MEIFKQLVINDLTKSQLLQRLNDEGVQFNKYAEILIQDPTFVNTGETETIQLVKVSAGDLGFKKPTIYDDIVKKAKDLGLKQCPLILAAYLRLEYLDQPEGPYLKVASPKVGNSDDYPRGLYLRNIESKLWLRGFRASDDWEYPLDMEFIFQR